MATALTIAAIPAVAQETPPETPAAEAPKKKKSDHNLLLIPVPLSNPSTGTGIAVGGVLFYNPKHEPQQWVTGAGVLYTDSGAKGIGAFHTMTLRQDRLRFKLIVAYTEGPSDYFGTGSSAGDAGEEVELTSRELHIQVQGQMRLIDHGYVGLRYLHVRHDMTPLEDVVSTVPLPPAEELKSIQAMMGPTLSYDTRDSGLLPRSGMLLSGTWMIGVKALGNDFPHTKFQASGNFYAPIDREATLAMRGSICAVTGHVPFYDLCLFGSGPDLRGYQSGRYRDRANWALQAELRQRLSSRFGGVAFIGVGGIAPSLGKIVGSGDFLPSTGVGLRYRPFKHNDVNLRVDLAVGLRGKALYVGISEAF